MASQRHKREHRFLLKANVVEIQPPDGTGLVYATPRDSAEEVAEAVIATDKGHNEIAAWPTSARETVVPI